MALYEYRNGQIGPLSVQVGEGPGLGCCGGGSSWQLAAVGTASGVASLWRGDEAQAISKQQMCRALTHVRLCVLLSCRAGPKGEGGLDDATGASGAAGGASYKQTSRATQLCELQQQLGGREIASGCLLATCVLRGVADVRCALPALCVCVPSCSHCGRR